MWSVIVGILLYPSVVTQETMDIPALGRSFKLGSLYDIKTGSLVSSTVFRQKIPDTCIEEDFIPYSMSETEITTKLSEKLDLLNLNANVKVDILAGLVKVARSAEILNEDSKSDNFAQITHFSQRTTSKVTLQYQYDDLKDLYKLHILKSTKATHMVLAITYGCEVAVSVTQKLSSERDVRNIQGELALSGSFSKFLEVNGDGKLENSNRKTNSDETLKVEVKTDLPEPSGGFPDNVEGVKPYLKQIPEQLSKINNGKGKHIIVHLIDLNTVRSLLAIEQRNYTFVTDATTTVLISAVDTIEKIFKTSARLNALRQQLDNEVIDPKVLIDIDLKALNLKNISRLYKDHLAIYVTKSRSNDTSTSAAYLTLLHDEKVFNELHQSISYIPEQHKAEVFEIFSKHNVTVIGKSASFSRAITANKEVHVLIIPAHANYEDDIYMAAQFYFVHGINGTKLVVDCTFYRRVCDRLEIPQIVQFGNGIYNKSMDPPSFEKLLKDSNKKVKTFGIQSLSSISKKLNDLLEKVSEFEDEQTDLNDKYETMEEDLKILTTDMHIKLQTSCDGEATATFFTDSHFLGSNESIVVNGHGCCKNLVSVGLFSRSMTVELSSPCVVVYDMEHCIGKYQILFPMNFGKDILLADLGDLREKIKSVRLCSRRQVYNVIGGEFKNPN